MLDKRIITESWNLRDCPSFWRPSSLVFDSKKGALLKWKFLANCNDRGLTAKKVLLDRIGSENCSLSSTSEEEIMTFLASKKRIKRGRGRNCIGAKNTARKGVKKALILGYWPNVLQQKETEKVCSTKCFLAIKQLAKMQVVLYNLFFTCFPCIQ